MNLWWALIYKMLFATSSFSLPTVGEDFVYNIGAGVMAGEVESQFAAKHHQAPKGVLWSQTISSTWPIWLPSYT